MENFWLMFGVGGAVLGAIVLYCVFMLFLPEWVGITGKVALDAEKSHLGGDAKESSFWVTMNAEPVKAKTTENEE